MNLTNKNAYWFRLFVALSLLSCAVFGGNMYESSCAAAWRLRYYSGVKGWWARTVIWTMNLMEPDHCKKSAAYYQKIKAGLREDLNG